MVVAVIVVLSLSVWWVTRPRETAVAPTPTPSTVAASPSPTQATSSAPATSAAPKPITVSSAPSAFAGCDAIDEEGFVPTSFEMQNPPAQEPVLSLGRDADGNIAAPPPDAARTASWWNEGPRPGSDAGKVVLSIHTYRNGGALGNEMYANGEAQLEAGDLIRLKGADGRTACYEFVEAKKVWVEDYDPNSDVMVDYAGDPMLAIVICWDFDRSTEIWESRIFFYGKPVSA